MGVSVKKDKKRLAWWLRALTILAEDLPFFGFVCCVCAFPFLPVALGWGGGGRGGRGGGVAVVNAFKPSIQKVEADGSLLFQDSLVYLVSSGVARAT